MQPSGSDESTNLGIIFSVACVQRNGFQVQTAIQVDRGNYVLKGRDDALDSGNMLLLQGEWRWCRGYRRSCWRGGGTSDSIGDCSGLSLLRSGVGVGEGGWSREGEVGGRRLGLVRGLRQCETMVGLLNLLSLLLLLLLLLKGILLLGSSIGTTKVDLTSGKSKRHDGQRQEWGKKLPPFKNPVLIYLLTHIKTPTLFLTLSCPLLPCSPRSTVPLPPASSSLAHDAQKPLRVLSIVIDSRESKLNCGRFAADPDNPYHSGLRPFPSPCIPSHALAASLPLHLLSLGSCTSPSPFKGP